MCTKKGNPNFVEISGRFYHRDVVFPVWGDHSCAEYDPDAEVIEPDDLAQHGMYTMYASSLYEPECPILGSRYSFESEDERDNRIYGDDADDPVDPNGDPLDMLIAAEESAAKSGVRRYVLRTNKNDTQKCSRFVLVRKAGFGIRRHAEDYAFLREMEEPTKVFDVDEINFGHGSRQRIKTLLCPEKQNYHAGRKVTSYGPHGKQLVKHVPYESHGVHGRKRARPKHVTVRGAHVRADIVLSTRRGPRCVGLVAAPRKCT